MRCPSLARSGGGAELTALQKTSLVSAVNQEFTRFSLPANYTENKLDSWTANCLYRWRCKQREYKPRSWRANSESDEHAPRAATFGINLGYTVPLPGPAKRQPSSTDTAQPVKRSRPVLADVSDKSPRLAPANIEEIQGVALGYASAPRPDRHGTREEVPGGSPSREHTHA